MINVLELKGYNSYTNALSIIGRECNITPTLNFLFNGKLPERKTVEVDGTSDFTVTASAKNRYLESVTVKGIHLT